MARTTHQTRFELTAKDKTKRAFKSVGAGLGGLKKRVTGLHAGLIGLAGIGGFGFLAKSIVDVNAEFQTIKSSLKTVTGSTEAAAKAFDLIEDFATTTPFALKEVTQSFIKLKALGLDPSEEALTSYGNTASALGKSLDQMIEAVADAATGEFERLKEFGIKAKKQGDEVSFTFQGITTTIKNNSEEIQGYLMGIGNNQFGSAMADQMKNITPALDNFGTAIDGVMVAIGEAGFNEVFAELVNNTTAWINSLDPQDIKDFTMEAIDGFADIIDIIADLKAAYDFIQNSVARTTVIVDDNLSKLNFTDIFTDGNNQELSIPGGHSAYRLGDFNNLKQGAPIRADVFRPGDDVNDVLDFRKWAMEFRKAQIEQDPTRSDPENSKWIDQTFQNGEKQDETNNILREIASGIRETAGITAQ